MKPTNHSIALAAALTIGLSGAAAAQDYPSDRITFIVGFSAGGYADSVSRLIAEHVSNVLGQPVIVENRPGAASNIAAGAVATAPADGYTVLGTTTAVAANATLYQNLTYSLLDDLVPVAAPVAAPEQFATRPETATSLDEFLGLARADLLTYGSAGIGSGSHLATSDFFANHADVEIDHVPFQGGAPAMQAVLGGHVDGFAATASANIVAQVEEGTLACLGIASASRYRNLPDCPTFDEQGYDGFQAASWVGFFVPAGTPDEIVATLNEAINSAIEDPEFSERLQGWGELTIRDPAETAEFVANEVAVWGERVELVGVTVE